MLAPATLAATLADTWRPTQWEACTQLVKVVLNTGDIGEHSGFAAATTRLGKAHLARVLGGAGGLLPEGLARKSVMEQVQGVVGGGGVG